MIITNTPFQKLEVKPMNNDAIAIVEKNKVDGEWILKIIILNRRQALGIYQAISDIVLGGLK